MDMKLQTTVAPTDSELAYWIDQWDRMQEAYNPDRADRFRTLTGIVGAVCPAPNTIVDLGCGTGSVMQQCLEAFPTARVIGIDMDSCLLALAEQRLGIHGNRASVHQLDFRTDAWADTIPNGVDAVVSATALHWLSEAHLGDLYAKVSSLLRPGGIFLNADHVGSGHALVQRFWASERAHARDKRYSGNEWSKFWDDYFGALGEQQREMRTAVLGPWEGVEQGLPLQWQLNRLTECGFSHVDCFYRFHGDAIYGGIK